MTDFIADVKAFHGACGLPSSSAPVIPDADRVRLRYELIAEEVCRELLPDLLVMATQRGRGRGLACDGQFARFERVADAIADSIYVLVGTALEFGIPLDRVWAEVQRANMDKSNGPKREDGKQLKPDDWQPPDIAAALWGDSK